MEIEIDARLDGPGKALSNITNLSFTFRGVYCKSMEGLLQSLKFKDPAEQEVVCSLGGWAAKKIGKCEPWWEKQELHFQGETFKRDSDKYWEFLNEAYLAKFTTNQEAHNALMITGEAILKHNIGTNIKDRTILTEREFCTILTNLRTKFRAEQFMDF